jgi:hypothetical protein
LLFFSTASFGQQTNLFPVYPGGKAGYINEQGKIVIEPQFLAAYKFSEGLAVVRIAGTYGYINESGKVVIPAEYDFALPFSEGLAIVYKEAKPFFINALGQKVFDHE